MNKKIAVSIFLLFLILTPLIGSVQSVQAESVNQWVPPGAAVTSVEEVNDYFTIEHLSLADGTALARYIINGPPEPLPEYEEERQASIQPLPSAGVLLNFPSYDWVFGCSAVSGAMIAGYYDMHGYPNMYAGEMWGGVMPGTDMMWPEWKDSTSAVYPNNPLVASHQGVDGRTTKGSIDDYWISYNSYLADPYITGAWTQHTWGSAIGDYMKTSQSDYVNPDGATSFYARDGSNEILTCSEMEEMYISDRDGTYGVKLFYEARGYTVTDCYFQSTDNRNEGAFSLADFQAQIDAGHPVMLHLEGHTIVGYGYVGNTVYIRDTWDNDPTRIHTMVWDDDPRYSGFALTSASIVNIKPSYVASPLSPAVETSRNRPIFAWSQVGDSVTYQVEIYLGATLKYSRTITNAEIHESFCFRQFLINLADGQYKWRVKAKVGGVWKAWSPFLWFKVAASPTPVLPDGTTPEDTPRFKWEEHPGATSYQIQVFKGDTWIYKKTVWSPYCSGCTCMKRFWRNLDDGYYKWRVRGKVDGEWQNWSDWKWFHVVYQKYTANPYWPSGFTGTHYPRYIWRTVTDASTYRIQLYQGSIRTYQKTIWGAYCSGGTCKKQFWTYLDDGYYKWRAQAKVDGIWGPWSDWRYFHVQAED